MQKLLIAGICMAMAAATYASVVNLNPTDDTAIWYRTDHPEYSSYIGGADPDIDNYTYNIPITAVGYYQFDLSSLSGQTITEASFSLAKVSPNPVNSSFGTHSDNTDTIVEGRFAAYGLLNVDGNTPQNWDESTLNGDGIGSEIDLTVWTGVSNQFDGARTVDLDGYETITGGTNVTVSGSALVSFLQGRLDDGGLATLMTDIEDGGNGKGFAFASKESTEFAIPVLSVTVIPEPATIGLIGVFGTSLFLVRRRFRI